MRKLALAFVCFLVLVAAIIGGLAGKFLTQHIAGKEIWQTWKAERIAKGDHFEWSQLVPPDVPDAENFAKAPLIAGAILDKSRMDPRFKALGTPKTGEVWSEWKEGRKADLKSFEAAQGNQDQLNALAPYAPVLKELKEASMRPHSKIPVDYSESETPALLGFRAATHMLSTRALAHLAKGNSEAAFDDVQTCLRMANHLKSEPCFLANLLRSAILGNAMQVIWEGLIDHRWNARQLEILQQELLRMDLLSSARLAWEGQRLDCINLFIRTAEGLPAPKGFQNPTKPEPPKHFGTLTKGWWYRNVLEMDRFYIITCLEIIDPKAHRVYPEKYISPIEWYEQRKYRKDLLMALIAIPALLGQHERQSRLQSYLDQAAIVCALERYRLAKGEYPSELQQLSPTFMSSIPWDITTGKPLHYAREGTGFQLYSVGWDQKDDHGALAWKTEEGKRVLNDAKGDWPWLQAQP